MLEWHTAHSTSQPAASKKGAMQKGGHVFVSHHNPKLAGVDSRGFVFLHSSTVESTAS